MIERILIATDGSAHSQTALEYGIYIAGKLEARLTGLHVMELLQLQAPVFSDISGSIGIPPCQEFLPVMENSLETKADAILQAFRDRCRKSGLVPEVKKCLGVIDEIIIEEGRQADLILLAQRGEHFHLGGGAILGTTAESVVRKSGKPVLVTPAAYREIESMALAYDGSSPAGKALEMAAELSEKAAWPLTVITVSNDPAASDRVCKQAETMLDTWMIDWEMIQLTGREDKAILHFLRDGSVELLVMGAYGHNRLRELLVGSTTSQVIRKSPIPVLLTR
ncbi:MAG: universal stress protein [Syntrophaceae bacterium]|nr:universal stress protein [Syntrophaceae bacterium]